MTNVSKHKTKVQVLSEWVCTYVSTSVQALSISMSRKCESKYASNKCRYTKYTSKHALQVTHMNMQVISIHYYASIKCIP